MTRNVLTLCCATAVIMGLGLACSPQYAPRPGASGEPAARSERGHEHRTTLGEVPPAVREAILARAGDNPVTEVEEIRFTDRTEYEAEWREDGEEVEVQFAADGTVVRSGDDDDEDDDGTAASR